MGYAERIFLYDLPWNSYIGAGKLSAAAINITTRNVVLEECWHSTVSQNRMDGFHFARALLARPRVMAVWPNIGTCRACHFLLTQLCRQLQHQEAWGTASA